MSDMKDEHRANLRLSAETYEAIDALRRRLPGNVSRNTWIALAIDEKIQRDMANSKQEEAGHGCQIGGH